MKKKEKQRRERRRRELLEELIMQDFSGMTAMLYPECKPDMEPKKKHDNNTTKHRLAIRIPIYPDGENIISFKELSQKVYRRRKHLGSTAETEVLFTFVIEKPD